MQPTCAEQREVCDHCFVGTPAVEESGETTLCRWCGRRVEVKTGHVVRYVTPDDSPRACESCGGASWQPSVMRLLGGTPWPCLVCAACQRKHPAEESLWRDVCAMKNCCPRCGNRTASGGILALDCPCA